MTDATKTHATQTNQNPSDSSDQPLGQMNQTAQSAQEGIDAAGAAVHPAIDRVIAGAHQAVDNADHMAEQTAEAIESAGVKGEEFIAAGTSYMREHPLLALGLAATAGYVLSRVLTSR